jgi:hypothetical protein
MNSEGFKYRLEPYKGTNSRHRCPRCRKSRNFARYIDTNGNYVGDNVGRCNSEVSCGYHQAPEKNSIVQGGFTYEPLITTYLKPKDISKVVYKDNLYKFLSSKYNKELVKYVFNKYLVRSSDLKWKGATVFYQRDSDDRFRTGKIILYNQLTGKRVKEPYSHIYWSHKSVADFDFVLEQCLFGEHLLSEFDNTKGNIYLVESEKTCIIASLFYKDDLFIATGGLSNLSPKKLAVLKDYNVEAIPDKGGYDYWKEKLEPLGITVNTVMEESDAQEGSDIADLLIN